MKKDLSRCERVRNLRLGPPACLCSVTRGLDAHSPWDDGIISFGTAGCYTPGVHRLSGAIGATIGQWELITYTYDNGVKNIYRGTTLINSGAGFLPLTNDHTNFFVGNESTAQVLNPTGRFDKFTLWNGALTPAENCGACSETGAEAF